jgi:hypothetical protein
MFLETSSGVQAAPGSGAWELDERKTKKSGRPNKEWVYKRADPDARVKSEMSAKNQKAKKKKLLDRRGNAGQVPPVFSEVATTLDR